MGITYTNKPDFIERMIEVGSQHFFLAHGNLCFAAADAEIGEHIGIRKQAADYAADALWHLRKTLEMYVGLVNSLEDRPISDKAKDILRKYDFDELRKQVKARATIMTEDAQWTKFVASARRIDPLQTIKDFVAEVKGVESKLQRLADELADGQMNPPAIHEALAAFMRATVFGQYIAEFNRDTRERFAG